MKSFYVLPHSCSTTKLRLVSSITGMHCKQLLIDYLGCKLFKGKTKSDYFQPLVDKLNKRLAGWKGKLLTVGGRMLLIKHVLATIPL